MAAPAGLASTTGARAPEPHETAGIGESWPHTPNISAKHLFQRLRDFIDRFFGLDLCRRECVSFLAKW